MINNQSITHAGGETPSAIDAAASASSDKEDTGMEDGAQGSDHSDNNSAPYPATTTRGGALASFMDGQSIVQLGGDQGTQTEDGGSIGNADMPPAGAEANTQNNGNNTQGRGFPTAYLLPHCSRKRSSVSRTVNCNNSLPLMQN